MKAPVFCLVFCVEARWETQPEARLPTSYAADGDCVHPPLFKLITGVFDRPEQLGSKSVVLVMRTKRVTAWETGVFWLWLANRPITTLLPMAPVPLIFCVRSSMSILRESGQSCDRSLCELGKDNLSEAITRSSVLPR